jgi:hypothetical protein
VLKGGPGPFFFEINGWAGEKRVGAMCHVPIRLTQGPVPHMDGCPIICVVQERVPKDGWSLWSQNDMCRLESSSDRISPSPWVHLGY